MTSDTRSRPIGALVSGGARGIGFACASRLAARNRVVIADVDAPTARPECLLRCCYLGDSILLTEATSGKGVVPQV